MRIAINTIIMFLLIACLPFASGCSKEKDSGVPPAIKVDASKSISEIEAEAEKMNVEQLKAALLKYKEVVDSKTAEIDKLAKEMMVTMVSDSSGEKTKELSAQTKKLSEAVQPLAERLEVYRKKFEEKGGDVSSL